jgi:hypothetical protein
MSGGQGALHRVATAMSAAAGYRITARPLDQLATANLATVSLVVVLRLLLPGFV